MLPASSLPQPDASPDAAVSTTTAASTSALQPPLDLSATIASLPSSADVCIVQANPALAASAVTRGVQGWVQERKVLIGLIVLFLATFPSHTW